MSLTLFEEDACSTVFHDTLLHCESLSVVSASNFEHVAFVVITHYFALNFLAHSPVEERTAASKDTLGLANATLGNSGSRTLTLCFHHQSQLTFAHQIAGLRY